MSYKIILQHDESDCAAACLASICLYYKKEISLIKLRDIMNTDQKGTSLFDLNECSKKLGFNSVTVKVDRNDFNSSFTLPCIANVVNSEGLSHFIIIYKINKKNIIIGDPSFGIKKFKKDEFFNIFLGVLLILQPNELFSIDNKNGSSLTLFYFFKKYILPNKKLFIYSILASIIITILSIFTSLFNKILLDEILPYKLKDTLTLILIIFSIITVFQLLISFIRQWMMLHLSQKIDMPLLIGYFKHIYKLPMKFFASRKTGDIITRFSDAFTIKNIYTNLSLTLIMDLVMTTIFGIILFNMNLNLFAIILLITVIDIIIVLIFKKPYKKINENQMKQNSKLNSKLIEGLHGIETIKCNVIEEFELDEIESEYIKLLRIGFNEGMLSNIQTQLSGLISALSNFQVIITLLQSIIMV